MNSYVVWPELTEVGNLFYEGELNGEIPTPATKFAFATMPIIATYLEAAELFKRAGWVNLGHRRNPNTGRYISLWWKSNPTGRRVDCQPPQETPWQSSNFCCGVRYGGDPRARYLRIGRFPKDAVPAGWRVVGEVGHYVYTCNARLTPPPIHGDFGPLLEFHASSNPRKETSPETKKPRPTRPRKAALAR